MNSFNVVGNLVRDPETHYTQNGFGITESAVAANYSRKSADGTWEEHAAFVDIKVLGGSGESFARFFSKGSKVALSGEIQMDRWQNAEGQNRSKLYLLVRDWSFCESKGSRPQRKAQPAVQDDDDLPF